MARIVLVADDSPTIQKKALGILKGEGFEVETVSNGVAAIKRLAVLHPVVILADVSMPGRDGYEVCEFVKKSAELSHVPVLLVASDMEPYDDARGAEVRADGIIKKPFEAHELISIVVKFAEQFEAATSPRWLRLPRLTERRSPRRSLSVLVTKSRMIRPTVGAARGAGFFRASRRESHSLSPPGKRRQDILPSPAGGNGSAVLNAATRRRSPWILLRAGIRRHHSCSRAAECPCRGNSLGRGGAARSQSLGATHRPIPPAPAPSFLEGLEAATPEPVFIEEQPAPTPEPPSSAIESHNDFPRSAGDCGAGLER